MKRALTALAATAAIAGAAFATPSTAEARGWHHHGGWGWGPAVVGGLAAGALLGGAYAYGPGYGYYRPGYYAYGDCYVRRRWTPYGWRWRRICY
jgi:hypothetical protein